MLPGRSVGEDEGFSVGELLGGEDNGLGVGSNVDGIYLIEDGSIDGLREGWGTVKDSEGDMEIDSVGLTDGKSEVVAGGARLKLIVKVTHHMHGSDAQEVSRVYYI